MLSLNIDIAPPLYLHANHSLLILPFLKIGCMTIYIKNKGGSEPVDLPITRRQLFREVQQRFNHLYPFLKLEFLYEPDSAWMNGYPDKDQRIGAIDLLQKDIGLSDAMTVIELENALQEWFATKIAVLQKNGSFWMSTYKAEDSTLRQHNDRANNISPENK
jgi:hypothetical protein